MATKNEASIRMWVVIFVVGLIGLFMLLPKRDRRSDTQKMLDDINRKAFVKDSLQAILGDRSAVAKSKKKAESRQKIPAYSRYGDKEGLAREVVRDMSAIGIVCLGAMVAESGCLRVAVLDNGQERDGLALTICSTAKQYGVSCVTIVDPKMNTLGRSMCR